MRWIGHTCHPVYDDAGRFLGTRGSNTDITAQKEMEEDLRESERRYHSLFQNMLHGFAHCKMIFEDGRPEDFVYLSVNEAFYKLTGLRDVVGRRVSDVIPGIRESHPGLLETYGRVSITGRPERFETYSKTFGGWLSISVYSTEPGFFVAVFDNITEHKQAEQNILRLNRTYAVLSDINQLIVRERDGTNLVQETCRVAIAHGKFQMAWIGFLNEKTGLFEEAAWAHADCKDRKGFRNRTKSFLTKEATTAVRAGKPLISNDIEKERGLILSSAKDLVCGFRSMAAFPISGSGSVTGVIIFCSAEQHSFDDEEVLLLDELAMDISFALESLAVEEQRKEAVEALYGSEQRYRKLFDEATEGIGLADRKSKVVLDVNRAFLDLSGYERSEIVGRPQTILQLVDKGKPANKRSSGLNRPGNRKRVLDAHLATKSGQVRNVEIKTSILDLDGKEVVQAFFRDITEEVRNRRERETTLKLLRLLNKQSLTHELIRGSTRILKEWTGCENVKICLKDDSAPNISLFTRQESLWSNSAAELRAAAAEADWQAMERIAGDSAGYESWALIPLRHGAETFGVLQLCDRTAGRFTPGLVSSLEGAAAQVAIGLVHRQAQAALVSSEQRMRDISEAAGEFIFEFDANWEISFVSGRVKDILGYTPEEILGKPVSGYMPESETKRMTDFVKKHLRSRSGFRDLEYMALHKSGRPVWLSSTAGPHRGPHGRLLAFRGAALDITRRKQTEENLAQAMNRLKKSLVDTVRVISLIVETRDPYTSGHQKKVSGLAGSIALQMGLEQETIEHITTAGVVHDIGKMAVPAEILSKPSRLTGIELGLIQAHPQAGYDILKDAGLPNPVAEIVLQHHERLDGSGYPRGLKDGEILLEARIVSVADVVEAIASHRPYRPALGIDAALDEIEKNKGILYDGRAVEACLRLFREKGFTFE